MRLLQTTFLLGLVFGINLVGHAAEREIEFNRDVRPILSDKCFACHGPDEKTREAELRLDLRESAIADRDGSYVISPGKPELSTLLERITSQEEYEQMPPPDAGQPLNAEEVDIIKRWIKQGAAYEAHWAYLAPQRPEVPTVDGKDLAAIDGFIRRQQAAAEMEMNQPADKRTLIRRLYFDLTGLPPTPEVVADFQVNQSPAAYEKLVDELLASPHYGERMAIYWLDLVRYADTLGYHGDQVRSVSPYRDYVISAFNQNLSFDQFTIEQLAGDLLPAPTLSQKVASTYNRLNRASGEGGVQPKEYLAKYSADRVRTAGSVWLGSTFGCAECHDHKFDPFSTKDFYSFAAFFADIKEQGIVRGANHIEKLPVPTPEQSAELEKLTQEIEAARQAFLQLTPELEQEFAAWQQASQAAADRWQTLNPAIVKGLNGTKLTADDLGIISAAGKNPDKETYELEFKIEKPQVGALRLDVFADDKLPSKGPGRAGNGNFVVNEVVATLDGKKLEWAKSYGSHGQNSHPPENLVTNQKGWAILPKAGNDHYLILEAKDALAIEGNTGTLKVLIHQNHGSGHTLGKFRLSLSEDSAATSDSIIPSAQVAELLKISPEDRTEQQYKKLLDAFRQQTPLLTKERDQLQALDSRKKQIEGAIVTTLVTVSTTPREMRVLPRGDWMSNDGEVVTPAVPEFLQPQSHENRTENLTRLDLANWLTSKENPLVARTFVNRLWMLYFGHGLCRSVDDLGSQGEWPTHPELLDWLAVEFVESGWDIKHMVKLMVMSETYRQSSVVSPQMRSRDPYNKLFARQTRQRLDAEMIRDNALAVSGLLVNQIGGPSAKPYQPAGYWSQLNFPKRKYQADLNQDQYRRGLYTHWQRTFLHPSLLAFDAPAREECTAKRERSNTPLQALVLLNDPTYVEAARVLATKIVSAGNDFQSRLNFAYQRVLSRAPNSEEEAVMQKLYEKEFERFAKEDAAAKALLKTGIAPAPQDDNAAEIAAWTSLSRVLLNLHETITKY